MKTINLLFKLFLGLILANSDVFAGSNVLGPSIGSSVMGNKSAIHSASFRPLAMQAVGPILLGKGSVPIAISENNIPTAWIGSTNGLCPNFFSPSVTVSVISINAYKADVICSVPLPHIPAGVQVASNRMQYEIFLKQIAVGSSDPDCKVKGIVVNWGVVCSPIQVG